MPFRDRIRSLRAPMDRHHVGALTTQGCGIPACPSAYTKHRNACRHTKACTIKVDNLSAAAETCPRLPWRGYSPDRLHSPLTEGSSFNGDRMWTSKASPSGCQSLALRDILTASARTSVGSGDGGCEDQRPDRHPFTPGTITPLHVRYPSNRSPSCRDSDAKRSDSR